jgi:CBS domain-containing protein
MSVARYARRPAVTVSASDTLLEAARRMRQDAVGSLVVVEGGRPTGMLTDRDLALDVLCDRLDARSARAGSLARGPVVSVLADAPLREAARLMRRHGLRRLPVVDEGGGLVGILASDDLLELAAGELSGLGVAIRAQAPAERGGAGDTRGGG